MRLKSILKLDAGKRITDVTYPIAVAIINMAGIQAIESSRLEVEAQSNENYEPPKNTPPKQLKFCVRGFSIRLRA